MCSVPTDEARTRADAGRDLLDHIERNKLHRQVFEVLFQTLRPVTHFVENGVTVGLKCNDACSLNDSSTRTHSCSSFKSGHCSAKDLTDLTVNGCFCSL